MGPIQGSVGGYIPTATIRRAIGSFRTPFGVDFII